MLSKPITAANYNIPDGDAGIYETVNYMWSYALRDVAEPLVKQLVKGLIGGNDLATIRNIYDWVWKNVKYANDPPDREMITSPIHFVNGNRKTGDCDCMTTLLVCLLEAAGFESAITVIAWRLDEYTHVFAEVKHGGKWMILDPTLKENGFGEQDKKARRLKRTTKKDMQRLTVLADESPENTSVHSQDRPLRRINKCHENRADGRKNKNVNNININFGTNVENSHNPSSYRSDSRQIGASELPKLVPNYPTSSETTNKPIVLKPVKGSDGKTYWQPSDNEALDTSVSTPENITLPPSSVVTLPDVIGAIPDNVLTQPSNTIGLVYVQNSEPPSYVPPLRNRGKGFVEFP